MHGVALQTQYPEYCARYDMDKDAAIEARKRILQYAADNSLTLVGMHFPPATKEWHIKVHFPAIKDKMTSNLAKNAEKHINKLAILIILL